MPNASKAFARVGGILLAAGSSHRFSGDKQLARFHGHSLLLHAALALKQSGANPLVAVLKPEVPLHEDEVAKAGVLVTVNSQASSGMSTTVRAGLHALPLSELSAVLITSCDQPLVTGEHLQDFIAAWQYRRPSAVAAAYSGIIGVPAVFSASLFPRLLELEGDRGAGQLLRSIKGVFPFELPEAAFDIDTVEQLRELESL